MATGAFVLGSKSGHVKLSLCIGQDKSGHGKLGLCIGQYKSGLIIGVFVLGKTRVDMGN